MLVTITYTLESNAPKAIVDTESNALENAYIKSYGEPTVELGGSIPYVDGTRDPQSALGDNAILGTEVDGGNSRTLLYLNPVVVNVTDLRVGDAITISGAVNQPINGTFTIAAVDDVHDVVAVSTILGVTTENPFQRAVEEGTITIGAQQDYQTITGFVDNTTTLVIQLKDDTDLNLTLVTPGDSMTISGVSLEPALNGTFTITAVSAVNKTITIASQSLTSQPEFSVDYPQCDVTTVPGNKTFSKSSELGYVKTGAPFEFSLSLGTDAEAWEKVRGWAKTVKDRISAAMTTLKANPNPTAAYPETETYEV
jgi:hypothetical protein